MAHPPVPSPHVNADEPLARFTDRAELLAALFDRLQARSHATACQLMWLADGVQQALFRQQPTLRLPVREEWLSLAAGQPASGGTVTYLPMVVLNELRGWVALQGGHVPADLPELVTQAGFALALLEQRAFQLTARRELAALDTIGRLLSSTLRLDQLLPNLAAIVRELMVAQDFYVALVDEASDEMYFAFLSSAKINHTPQVRWPIHNGLTGEIVRSGRPIVADDYVSECARRGIAAQGTAGIDFSLAWLGVPLRHYDRVLGVMVAGSTTPGLRYSAEDVHLLSSIAAQAGAAVANAQLYQRVEQQAQHLALTNRIGRTINATLDPQAVPMLIMQELQAALDVEDGAVLIEDPASGDLVVRYSLQPKHGVRLPRGLSVAGAALHHGQAIVVNDSANDPRLYGPLDRDGDVQTRSIICVPLTGRSQLRGVIQLRNKVAGQFTDADAALLTAVAEQAAMALENAERYASTDNALASKIDDLEQRNQQLSNIVAFSNALRAANSVREVGQQIIATVQAMTGSPRISVGVVEAAHQRLRGVAQVGLPRLPRDAWIPLDAAQQTLEQGRRLGSMTHQLPVQTAMPEFVDPVVLALLDVNGTLVGSIALDQVGPHAPFDSALIKELEIIANQAASAIANAQADGEREQAVDQLTALNALSLAFSSLQLSTDEMMQMTVRGAIGTTNAVGGGACVLGSDDSFRRLVINLDAAADDDLLPVLATVDDAYVVLDEARVPATLHAQGIRSIIAVPVRGAKLTLGSIWIGYAYPLITPSEREMVVLYGKTAGAVLENTRLFDQVSSTRDRLASILGTTAEGMVMITADGLIASANAAFRQLLGLAGPIEGQLVQDIRNDPALVPDAARLAPMWDTVLSITQGHAASKGEASLVAQTMRDLAWSALPVRGTTKQQRAALLVLRDVTAERQAEKLRQDLSNMIVHDLRAPLTNMMVSVDLLLKQTSGPLNSAQQRMIEIAADSSHQMLDLVNSLLDIRRLEQQQLELYRQPVELFDLVESVFERLERIAGERQVQLANDTAALPPVRVDLELTRRILQNLIHNATKFSPRAGHVVVHAATASAADLPPDHPPGRWAVIEVADEGPGVPEGYRSLIFELFAQAPQGRGMGTGLGLAFCKLAVAAHGGMIWVEDGVSRGARFRLTLPLV